MNNSVRLKTFLNLKIYHERYKRGKVVLVTRHTIEINFPDTGSLRFKLTDFIEDIKESNENHRIDELRHGNPSPGYYYRLSYADARVRSRDFQAAHNDVSPPGKTPTARSFCYACKSSLASHFTCRGCGRLTCPKCLACHCDPERSRKQMVTPTWIQTTTEPKLKVGTSPDAVPRSVMCPCNGSSYCSMCGGTGVRD